MYCGHGIKDEKCDVCGSYFSFCCYDYPGLTCKKCNNSLCFDCTYYDLTNDTQSCSICLGHSVTDEQIFNYILKKYNLSKNDIAEKIKRKQQKNREKQ